MKEFQIIRAELKARYQTALDILNLAEKSSKGFIKTVPGSVTDLVRKKAIYEKINVSFVEQVRVTIQALGQEFTQREIESFLPHLTPARIAAALTMLKTKPNPVFKTVKRGTPQRPAVFQKIQP